MVCVGPGRKPIRPVFSERGSFYFILFFFFRFFLASFYTKYDKVHFLINAAFCGLSVIAKLPMFHGKRFFEINKW